MLTFLLFIFSGVGITNLVVNASLLDNPRDFITSKSEFLGGLVSCMMCSGFWVGFFMGIFSWENPVYTGATISVVSFLFSYYIEYVELLIALRAAELGDIDVREENDEKI